MATNMDLTFRAALEQDKPSLKVLNRAAYEEIVISQFGEWDDIFETKIFDEKWIEQKFTIVERNGILVAVFWVDDNDDYLFLREIQVAPIHQARGVGTRLVQRIIGEADQRSIPTRLKVLQQNRAIAWYQRLGFVFTGESTDTHHWMVREPLVGKSGAKDFTLDREMIW